MRTGMVLLLAVIAAWVFPVPASAALFGPGGPKTHTNSIGMELVLIPAGSFALELDVVNEFKEVLYSPKMIISKPFYLGKYEVTQEQWAAVMGNSPAKFKGRTNPVERVSWNDAQEFIKRLNEKEGHKRYRLPTEMEWEWAAKGGAGETRLWFFMENRKDYKTTLEEATRALGAYAWFSENSGSTTHPVGQRKPNPYGLYDIYGNVYEWVQDWSTRLPTDKEVRDYSGPADGSLRVIRGGSWGRYTGSCRSSYRYGLTPDYETNYVGFRLALSPE
ncbi:hypothetical protein FACS1894206_03870 [Deltaproteobacteria bacterium]|nr:hypothetical protein FACS1894206_03870 [Deltaproteobacteria bacterium]